MPIYGLIIASFYQISTFAFHTTILAAKKTNFALIPERNFEKKFIPTNLAIMPTERAITIFILSCWENQVG